MGGGNSINYTLEKYIKENCENNIDITEVDKSILNEKLQYLYQVFFLNNNAYYEYKKKIREIQEKEGKLEVNYDEEDTKFEFKSLNYKYSNGIHFCVHLNKIFIMNYPELYLIVLKIMQFLSRLIIIFSS